MGLTRELSAFAAATGFSRLPEAVIAKTRLVIMDTLGCGIAGYTLAGEELAPLLRLAKAEGAHGPAMIFCDGHKTSVTQAALANGGIIHTIDFDDTSATCFGHFGASLLPTVAALGQQRGASGAEVVAAFAVGYDIATRVGRTVWPSHYDHWHPTSTLGTIGAAVAAGKLLQFDEAAMERALCLAADKASGLRYCIDHGDFSKMLHPAMAAMKGVMAALLVEGGAKGPTGLLEYPSGFCPTFSAQPDLAAGTGELGAALRNPQRHHQGLPDHQLLPGADPGYAAAVCTARLLRVGHRRHPSHPHAAPVVQGSGHQLRTADGARSQTEHSLLPFTRRTPAPGDAGRIHPR